MGGACALVPYFGGQLLPDFREGHFVVGVKARPGINGSPELESRAEVLEWWADIERRGAEVEARPLDFELHGDVVIVRGYLRYRDGRTLAENQVFWLYEVHDGQITRMESHPSRKAALAAADVSS